MKIYYLIVVQTLLTFSEVTCHHHYPRKKSENLENTTQMGPSVEDQEVLREALHLLNIGKKTLGLGTENPDLLMQLIENSNDKADRVQHVLKDPLKNFTLPKGEQYLVLSGQDGHIRVDNYTNITATSDGLSSLYNDTGVDDVFKMVMEKRFPSKDGKGKLFHKITIIESNQLKPISEKEFPQHAHPIFNKSRVRRHKTRSLKRIFSIPRLRKKRSKKLRGSLARYPNYKIFDEDITKDQNIGDSLFSLYSDTFFPAFHMRRINFPTSQKKNKKSNLNPMSSDKNQFLKKEFEDKEIINLSDISSPSTEKLAENNYKSNSHELIFLEKSLITQLTQSAMTIEANDTKLRVFYQLGIAFFVMSVCITLVLVVYKLCSINKNLRTVEMKGTNVIVKLTKSIPETFGRQLGLLNKNKARFFEIPFGKMDYKLLPMEDTTADLEWQSEEGEWLKDQDLDMKGVYT